MQVVGKKWNRKKKREKKNEKMCSNVEKVWGEKLKVAHVKRVLCVIGCNCVAAQAIKIEWRRTTREWNYDLSVSKWFIMMNSTMMGIKHTKLLS